MNSNIKLSGLSSHTPLCKPEISVEYLKMAIRWAADAGAPVVNSDEGPKPLWTSKEMDYTLMKYTLTEASMVAERHGIKIGLAGKLKRQACSLSYQGHQYPAEQG